MCDQVAVKVEEEEEGLEYATPTQRTTLKNPTDHSGVPDVADLSEIPTFHISHSKLKHKVARQRTGYKMVISVKALQEINKIARLNWTLLGQGTGHL